MIKWSFAYLIARIIAFFGWIGFYKRSQFIDTPQYSGKKATIYAPNHQSGFMDPVVVAKPITGQTHFMVRADVFKNPIAAKLFRWLKMMPVYRQRDGKDSLDKNNKIFDNCYNLLKHKQGLIIFPEGNQNNKKSLRALKKGVSRVAFGAEEKFDFELGVQVVPVGINYGHHTKMNSSVHVVYGKPIQLSDYKDDYLENPAKTLNDFRKNLEVELAKLVINIQNKDLYETIENIRLIAPQLIHQKADLIISDLDSEIKAGQFFVKNIESWAVNNPKKASELKKSTLILRNKVKELRLKYFLFEKEKHNVIAPFTLLFILSPVHLLGLLFNLIPHHVLGLLIKNKIKDTHFHSSIKMLGGSVFFFIWYLLISTIIGLCFGWVWFGITFISAPVLGYFNLKYWILFLKTRGKYRYNWLQKNSSSVFKSAHILRKEILDTVDKMY